MTRHERLLENYEDALFSLLMEEVMLREGERLEELNRQLLADPGAAVPESLDRRCRKTIAQFGAGKRRRSAARWSWKALRAAAVVAALIATLFTTAFAVSEEFRTAALEVVRTVTGNYTKLDIRASQPEEPPAYFRRIALDWVPEGYAYSQGAYDECAKFENGEGDWFLISIDTFNFHFQDNFQPPYKGVEGFSIGDYYSGCVVKDGAVQALYQDSASDLTVRIQTSPGFTVEMAKEILENVRAVHGGPGGAGYFENARVGWLPEGFEFQAGVYDWYVKFRDGEGRWIWIYLYDGAGSMHIDTADAELAEDVSINGNEGLCVVKNGYVHVVTTDLEHLVYIDVIASDTLPVDTVKQIVEQIKILP